MTPEKCDNVSRTSQQGMVTCLKRNAIPIRINGEAGDHRKPMFLMDARQVGKTWLMRELGRSCCGLQQLLGQFDAEPGYYSDKNSGIDFVLRYRTEIIPVEARGGEDKPAPSFKRYISDHHPAHAIRYSKRGYRKDGCVFRFNGVVVSHHRCAWFTSNGVSKSRSHGKNPASSPVFAHSGLSHCRKTGILS